MLTCSFLFVFVFFCQSGLSSLSLIPEYDLCDGFLFFFLWHCRSLFCVLSQISLNGNLNEQGGAYDTVVIR